MSQLPPALRDRGGGVRGYVAYGRLADGVTLEQARSEMSNVSAQLAQQYPDTNKDITAAVTPFLDRLIGPQIKTIFWSLMGAVAFVLLIACSNVANLLLARAAHRTLGRSSLRAPPPPYRCSAALPGSSPSTASRRPQGRRLRPSRC